MSVCADLRTPCDEYGTDTDHQALLHVVSLFLKYRDLYADQAIPILQFVPQRKNNAICVAKTMNSMLATALAMIEKGSFWQKKRYMISTLTAGANLQVRSECIFHHLGVS